MKVTVIGVAGGTGSGKSTLVKRLQEAFGENDVATLCHDYYYKAHPELTYEERTKLNYDHPQAFDTDMMVAHIRALKENVPIEHPVYSFVEHDRLPQRVAVKPSKVIIVDGILIFENKELRDMMDIKVFVDTDADIRLARRMVAENPDKYYMPDQFANAANYLTHYENTAIEIWQQTEGQIDYLVCAVGTSGTLMGLSRFLHTMKPDIKVVCAHPTRGHYIQGLKNMEEAIVPQIYDPSLIDRQEMIESEEAIEMARQIIAREGIFAGMSSGAAMIAAIRTAQNIESGNIVVVFPDRAEKYLSTTMFDPFAD